MRGLLIMAAAALALAGCETGNTPIRPTKATTPVVLTPALTKAIHAGVARDMKDPDSARFGEIRAARDDQGTTMVCGYVNGRNSFGGYTGEQPFIGILNEKTPLFLLTTIGSSANERIIVRGMCAQEGMPI